MITYLLLLILFTMCYSYDEKIAIHAVHLAEASYCVSSVDNWNCDTCESSIILTNIVEEGGLRVLQGYDKETDSIFVSFRGSSNINNWINNIQIRKIAPYNDTNIEVSNGFYKEYNNVKPDIINNFNILTDKYNTNKIFITGHSSGGAMSTLMAFDIITIYTNYQISYLITFGSPRVGNIEFVDYMNSHNDNSYRVTHYYDMVPHLPEEFFGYAHISNEIWYNEENSIYKICNDKYEEDESCSNSCAPLHCTSTADHLYYLNVTMGNPDAIKN